MQALAAQQIAGMAGQKILKVAEKKLFGGPPKKNRPRNRRRGKGGGVASSKSQDVDQPSKYQVGKGKRRNLRSVTGQKIKNYSTPFSAPVSYDSVISNFEEMFQPRKITHPEYGAGSCIAFSTIVTSVGSNNATLPTKDNFIPFRLAGMSATLGNGFIDSTGAFVSGIWIHPSVMGVRMFYESLNWILWRPRRLRFRFQSSIGTNNIGSFTMALSRDPANFVEASYNTSPLNPIVSTEVLTQTVPNTMSNIYRDSILEMTKFPATPFFMEVAATDQFGTTGWQRGNNLATVAYIESHFCGRLAGLTSNLATPPGGNIGYLWCDGEIEMYQPTGSTLSIGSTIGPATPGPLTGQARGANRYIHNLPCLLPAGTNRFLNNSELIREFKNYYDFCGPPVVALEKAALQCELEKKEHDSKLRALFDRGTFADVVDSVPVQVAKEESDSKDGWLNIGRKWAGTTAPSKIG